MTQDAQQLQAAVQALAGQRALLGDAVVDASLAALHAQIAALRQAGMAADRNAQSLRQVSVLFLDIVGSTALSQCLDPEGVHAVMDGALAHFTGIVQAHQGRVLQYAGDNLLAAFGTNAAREDDAERAVRCGLALLDAGRALGRQVLEQHGHEGFNVRVGVHTGGVLLGGGVDEDRTIRGITVNIAARMEQTAPAGALRISHDTYRHVRGVFDVDPQIPFTVKGVMEPVRTYLVLHAKPRAFKIVTRGIEGVETRMIGRDAELEQLQTAFAQLHQSGAGLRRAVVVADAGVGKSRLVYEFENWIESRREDICRLRVRATPQTQSQPYGLLRDLLAWQLQIRDTDSMAESKRKLEDGVVGLFVAHDDRQHAQAHAHLLGQLIGLDFVDSQHLVGILDDSRQIRNRGFHAAAQVLRLLGTTNQNAAPSVLLIEDLHWADDASLDFLDYLIEVNRDVPMLLLALTRSTLFERASAKASANVLLAGALRIDLAPLDRRASHDLVRELLKKLPVVPSALRELVVGGAEGNPFYIEELVKMLVDQGAILTTGDHWTLAPDKLLSTEVPTTLAGVLQARLDGLPMREKHALQLASVIGLHFWDQALNHIDSQQTAQLAPLCERQLIVALSDSGDGSREYAFTHQLLHQVAYGTVLKGKRQSVHAKAAQWFSGVSGARANDFLALAAEHYAQADDDGNACEYFTRAAEYATVTHAHEAALAYTERALDLARPADANTRWRLLSGRERTLSDLALRERQRADLDALTLLAEALNDDGRRAEAVLRHCDMAMRTDDWQKGVREARKALALAERAGVVKLALLAQQRLSFGLSFVGEPLAARVMAEQGLAQVRALGLRTLESRFLTSLVAAVHRLGDRVARLEYALQAVSVDQKLGDRRGEVVSLTNLAVAYLALADFAQAQRCAEDALRQARMLGTRVLEASCLGLLSKLAHTQGQDALALAHAQASLDITLATGSSSDLRGALLALGRAEQALGRWDAATTAYEQMDESARRFSDAGDVNDALDGLATVALAQGDTAKALGCVERLLVNAATTPSEPPTQTTAVDGAMDHNIQLTIYRVLVRAQDPRANATLGHAYAGMTATANRISDDRRRLDFLNNFPNNREIAALWRAHGAGAPSPD